MKVKHAASERTVDDSSGPQRDHGRCRFALLEPIHDRDAMFCESFRDTIEGVGVTPIRLPARSLNAFAERWVRSVKDECLSKLILFGENSLRHALKEYVAHHHHERNHQGKDILLLFPEPAIGFYPRMQRRPWRFHKKGFAPATRRRTHRSGR